MTPGDWWRPGGARPAFHQSRLALLQRIRGGSCRSDTMSAWSLTSCIRRGRALRCRHPLGHPRSLLLAITRRVQSQMLCPQALPHSTTPHHPMPVSSWFKVCSRSSFMPMPRRPPVAVVFHVVGAQTGESRTSHGLPVHWASQASQASRRQSPCANTSPTTHPQHPARQ